MIIRDKRIKEEVKVNVGDLVTAEPIVGPVITGLVCYEEGADYPYFVLDLSDMEIIDGYEELECILSDFDLHAKREQLELIIK